MKNYNKTKPINIKEFDVEKAWWNDRKENEYAWKVSVEDIKASNYNLDIKNPNVEDDDHGDPEELLAKYQKLMGELAETRNSLKQELMTALDRTDT